MERKSSVWAVIALLAIVLMVLGAMSVVAASFTERRHDKALEELSSRYEKVAVEAKAYQRVLERWCLGDEECRVALEGRSGGEIRVWGGRIEVDCVDTEHSLDVGLYSLEAEYGMYGGIQDYSTITLPNICKYRYEENHTTRNVAEEE